MPAGSWISEPAVAGRRVGPRTPRPADLQTLADLASSPARSCRSFDRRVASQEVSEAHHGACSAKVQGEDRHLRCNPRAAAKESSTGLKEPLSHQSHGRPPDMATPGAGTGRLRPRSTRIRAQILVNQKRAAPGWKGPVAGTRPLIEAAQTHLPSSPGSVGRGRSSGSASGTRRAARPQTQTADHRVGRPRPWPPIRLIAAQLDSVGHTPASLHGAPPATTSASTPLPRVRPRRCGPAAPLQAPPASWRPGQLHPHDAMLETVRRKHQNQFRAATPNPRPLASAKPQLPAASSDPLAPAANARPSITFWAATLVTQGAAAGGQRRL